MAELVRNYNTLLKKIILIANFLIVLFLIPEYVFPNSPDKLVVKADFNFPPHSFMNKAGKPEGFDIDIVKAVAREMGLKLDLKLEKWQKIREELENGEIDAAIGMFKTRNRSRLVDFSTPYFIASYSIFVRKDSEIKGLEDISEKKIIAQLGDLGYDYLLENRLTEKIITKSTTVDALKALSSGIGDCAIALRLMGLMIIKNKDLENLHTTGSPVMKGRYCLGVKKGNQELVAKLNEGLGIIKTSGEYDKIYEKWFGIYEDRGWTYQNIIKYLTIVVLPLLLLIMVIFIWSWSLKIKVHQKTGELKESRENLKITLNSIGDAVIATDIEGKIRRMNPIAEKLTGWKFEEAENRLLTDIFRIFNNITREEVENPVEKVLTTGDIVGLANHTVLIAKDGNEFHIADSGAPIKDSNGETTGVVLVFRDVTEEYILQEQLRHSQKMDAIGQLAGGVAHDFNNLLTGIIGAAQLLKIRNRNMDQKSEEALEIILHASSRASDLTFKLLAFGRKGKIASSVIDVKNVLNDTIAILKRTVDKKITIKQEDSSTKRAVVGDSSELQNALLNIGINASQAMPNGGEILFALKTNFLNRAYCDNSAFDISEGDYIELEVRDNGCGIEKENIRRIFEPFYTTKEKGKGTGLGLAAVYGTVLDHRGEIKVYSEPGVGTSFFISLPCTEEAALKAPSDTKIHRGSGTILLVDDEEIIRITGRLMLEEMGYKVLTAVNGKEAINFFEKKHRDIDLVLMDMIMPELGGREALIEMKEIDRDCKVVISSGFAKNENLEELKKVGLSGFIRKPYRDFELSRVIKDIIGRGN